MKAALIIGRTIEDYYECRKYHITAHLPAPTTFLYGDYNWFDGQIIRCHTAKAPGERACTIERNERVVEAAKKFPYSLIVGTSHYHRRQHFPSGFGIRCFSPEDHDYPIANSGVFALWCALHEGYNPIYTVGLDMQTITMLDRDAPPDFEYIKNYVRDIESGRPNNGRLIELHGPDNLAIDEVVKLLKDYPDTKVYKSGTLSKMPVPIKKPTHKRGKNE